MRPQLRIAGASARVQEARPESPPCDDQVTTEYSRGDTLVVVGKCGGGESDEPPSGRDCGAWVQNAGWTVREFSANQLIEIPEIIWGADDCNGDGIPWCGGSLDGYGDDPLPDAERDWLWTSTERRMLYPPQERMLSLWTYDLEVGSEYEFGVVSSTTRGSYSLPGGSTGIVITVRFGPIRIISFPLELEQVARTGGTGRASELRWARPDTGDFVVEHLAILRSQIAIADTNYRDAFVVEFAVPGTTTSFVDTTSLGHLDPYYTIAGFDSDGRFVALSGSRQATFESETFSLAAPSDDEILGSFPIEFQWESVYGKQYDLLISEDPSFSDPTVISELQESSYTLTDPLGDHAFYYWRVRAYEPVFPDTVWCAQTAWRFGVNTENAAPDTFTLVSPSLGASVDELRPRFTWTRAEDPGDHVLYTLELGHDAAFDNVDVYEGLTHEHFYPPSDLPRDTLYWRVTAHDTHAEAVSNLGGSRLFTVDAGGPPFRFVRVGPQRRPITVNSGRTLTEESSRPTFEWHPSEDPDGGVVMYEVWLDTTAAFTTAEVYDSIADTSWTYPGTLAENEEYFWDVYAIDPDGDRSKSWGRPWSFDVNEGYEPPDSFSALTPSGLQEDISFITFEWEEPTDPDPNSVIGVDLWLSPDETFACKREFHYLPYGTSWGFRSAFDRRWSPSQFQAYAGSSWWCGDADSLMYGDEWVQSLRSGPIDLTECTLGASLSFMHKYDTEPPDWDGGVVRASSDGGSTWDILTPVVGSYDVSHLFALEYHCYGTPLPGYCGSSGGWVDAGFDLSSYCGSEVQIEFLFVSDELEYEYEGWHVDDIAVVADGDTLLFDDGGDTATMLECVPLDLARGQTYYWKLKARDWNSPVHETTDWGLSEPQSFTLDELQAVQGRAVLDGTADHGGIRVVLEPRSPLAVADTTYTDSSGDFSLSGIYPGTYSVLYSKDGYADAAHPEFYIFAEDVVLEQVLLTTTYPPPSGLVAESWDEEIRLAWSPPSARALEPHSTYFYVVAAVYHDAFESEYTDEVWGVPWYSGPVCYVAQDGEDAPGRGTFEAPLATVQQGIRTVGNADTVLLMPATYVEIIDFAGRNITVGSLMASGGDSSYIPQTVLDGDGAGSVVTFATAEDSTARLVGLTITGGMAENGGGVYVYGAAPVVSHCVIASNAASGMGGGLFCGGGASPSVMNVTLVGNSAAVAGGNVYVADGSPEVANTIIAYSTAGEGIGCGVDGSPTIVHSSSYGNAAGDSLCGTHHDNVFSRPVFCDTASGDYSLHEFSPCLPGGNAWGEHIGAQGLACSDTGPPAAPAGAIAGPGQYYGEIAVSWNPNEEPDLDYYNLERDTTALFGAASVVVSTPDTVLVDVGLEIGKEYFYRATAVDLGGAEGVASDTVSAFPQDVDLPPETPVELEAIALMGCEQRARSQPLPDRA